MKVEESLNVTFEEEAIEVNKTRPLGNDLEDKSLENNEIINIKESKSHLLDNAIEPKNINEALKKESWEMAMQEELNQFISNDVWELIPNPMDMTIIGTKWKTALAISTTEAEYVSVGKACQQALWMKQALVDYGI
nr:retrovirus-related Pol polyprotein from transposon TNT 1-94 [Tanacetum cinerariifolium]